MMTKYIAPENLLERKQHEGNGFMPQVDYETWRVAILNFAKGEDKLNFKLMSSHTLTDEVFVLLTGKALLFTATDDLSEVYVEQLEQNKIYNVKKGVCHCHLLEPNGKLLIVENQNTGKETSQDFPIDNDTRNKMRNMVKEIWG